MRIPLSIPHVSSPIRIAFCFGIIVGALLLLVGKYFFDNLYADAHAPRYELLSPKVASLSAEEFLEQQAHSNTFNHLMREEIQKAIAKAPGNVSFYYEDYFTGAWFGVNERVGYVPASLAKLPTIGAVFKKVLDSDGELTLETKVTIEPSDIDTRSGSMSMDDIGKTYTILELAAHFLNDSDNTAGAALKKLISPEDLVEARQAMGIPSLDVFEGKLNPKVYSNVFRSLYRSTYLPRDLSELILSLLQNTSYEKGIPEGVPDHVPIAHKIGAYQQYGSYHDCGIVYEPYERYFICVMTGNMPSYEVANQVIAELSRITYEKVHAD